MLEPFVNGLHHPQYLIFAAPTSAKPGLVTAEHVVCFGDVVVAGSFVVVDVSDDDSDVGLSAVVFDADSDAEVALVGLFRGLILIELLSLR